MTDNVSDKEFGADGGWSPTWKHETSVLLTPTETTLSVCTICYCDEIRKAKRSWPKGLGRLCL